MWYWWCLGNVKKTIGWYNQIQCLTISAKWCGTKTSLKIKLQNKTQGALRLEHFLDLHLIIFAKNGRTTTSLAIILSIKYLSFKKVLDRQSDIHATVKYIFLFLQIIIWGQKDWYETMKLKFTLMFFDSACPTRPSDTVTKYTIYPLSYWWK